MTKTSLHDQIGQLLICGFDGLEATEGILNLIRNHNLGSIIFFSRNIDSPEQVQRLTLTLQRAAKEAGHTHPLFIAVDQENGVVRRLGSSGTYLPGSMALGAIDSSSAAYQVATATAKELLALGINWNLAPDMDVNNNSLNPVIGVRSFSEDPHQVAKLGQAQVEAYHKQNIATSIKHFPGHGDTATDSHLGIPVIDKNLQELEQVELFPFRQAIAAKGDAYPSSVMISHISLPQIIKEELKPASIASEIATDLLRKHLRYDGLIITDCLEMDAVKDSYGTPRGAMMALQAGNDMSMISHTLAFQQEAFELIHQAIDDGSLDKTALNDSLNRVKQLKERFLSWDEALKPQSLDIIGCKEHLVLSDRLYNKVPTVVRDEQHLLPIRPTPEQKILFLAAHVPLTLAIDSEVEPFNSMYSSLQRRHKNMEYVIFKEDANDLTQSIQDADYVIVGTANGNLHPFQSELVHLASKHAKKLIVVAVINPYDLMAFPSISTYVVTYEYTPPAHEAFVRVLFGEIETHSHLPITIPNHKTEPAEPHCIQSFDSTNEKKVEAGYELWKRVFNDKWPLSFENFALVLSRFQEPCHFSVYKGDMLIGLALTQTLDKKTGQLALLMVDPAFRNKGVGTALNDRCLEYFRHSGVSVTLGSSYPRFFYGVPDNCKEAQVFFKNRGFTFTNTVWDLKGDLREYEMPAEIKARMEKEKIWFGTIQDKEEMKELMEFQKKYFEYWVSTYQHHSDLGDYHDLVVAREGDGHGKIIGSLVLFVTNGSHKYRTDLIWTDETLFTNQSGGMACVGVASEERGRGIGLGLVAFANKTLKERNVEQSYVDWVELTDFYSRAGYQKWRSCKLGEIK